MGIESTSGISSGQSAAAERREANRAQQQQKAAAERERAQAEREAQAQENERRNADRTLDAVA